MRKLSTFLAPSLVVSLFVPLGAPFLGACSSDPTGLLGNETQAVSTTPRHKVVHSVGSRAAVADAPPIDKAGCLEFFGVPCYGPLELRQAYGVQGLIDEGFDGTGETIVLIESFGSPTLAADLEVFDQAYGLPAPPSLQVLAPLGSVPFDPNDDQQVGWLFETTLDVEYAHAMAPAAGIVVLTSPVAETEGIQGLPEFLALETYALDHHLGKIISQSFGTTENTLFDAPGRTVIAHFEALYARARREHVTVLAATGDTGSTNFEIDGETLYPVPVSSYPATSPNVTAVGGTELYTDDDGNWASEVAWQGSGGGVSQVFSEPLYQRFLPRSDQRILGGHRGVPDLAADGGYNTPVICLVTNPFSGQLIFDLEFGTSVAAPTWAGIVADLNRVAGRPLGFLNDKLYLLGALGLLRGGLHDITVGNNTFDDPTIPLHVPGYDATTGWDPVTGWGAPKLDGLAQLLASMPDD